MTRGSDSIKRASCKHGHRAPKIKSAWCDINKDCTGLKLHDMCHNTICNCQKQITFSPKQFQLEGASFKKTKEKIFTRSQTAWNNF